MDDFRKLRLDAKEFLSDVRVLDCRQACGPIFEISWQHKVIMVPYDRPHVMEGVVGILLTARRLLDVGEHRYVGEHVLAVPTNWPPEGASRFGVAGEGINKNFLHICVLFL